MYKVFAYDSSTESSVGLEDYENLRNDEDYRIGGMEELVRT